MRPALAAVIVSLVLAVVPAAAQIDTSILRPVGYHPSDVTYFNTPYLANSFAMGGEWRQFSGFDFGTTFDYSAPANAAQFVNGYPQSLGDGTTGRGPFLRALLFGVNINNTDIRPAGWPAHDELAKGHYVLTWQGNADIRLQNGTFIPGESTVAETGSFANGRRVYLTTGIPQSLEIRQIVTPITDIKVWLPAVDNPATPGVNERLTTSLENQTFHPLLLERIADADWGFIRFMDWGKTNASPQQDWIDRRVPNHAFQIGVISDRQPSATAEGHRETGVAWEHMIALCNATNRNLWINVPHLATNDYITKLAQLIRFGSDGVNPYTTTNPNPVFPPLNANLKVYVEFSNEIWSSGFSFPQGNWAEEQAVALGITGASLTEKKAKFTARKFCDTWNIFQTIFSGSTSRLVRVAAIFTALDAYSTPFMTEINSYGQTLSPTVRPDVLALTTYFGNDIQGFVNTSGFTAGKLFSDPYWQSPLFAIHQHQAFTEWKRRILAGDSVAGSGPDATGTSGGFNSSLRTLANTTLTATCSTGPTVPCLPLIAYEGGPSIFTDTIDGGATTTDDNVTIFMEAMNRDPRIADVYRIHLDLAKSKGLWTHNPYVDTSQWSRFGQWGHLELLEQAPAASPKYSLMLEHFSLYSTLKHIDAAVGLVPSFVTPATLPTGIAGQAYTTTISTTGGNGARSIVVVGSLLDAGLTITNPTSDTLQISGTPITSRKNFILARVQDADGDPAWQTFTLQTFGGPGSLIQSNFAGTSPGTSTTWTPTFVLDSTKVSWDGIRRGAGITGATDNDTYAFSVVAPSDADSTMAGAIADSEFLTAMVTPLSPPLNLAGGELRFSTRRIGFHSAREYALFSSVDGFTTALYTSPSTVTKDNFDETEHIVILPQTFANISTAVTFRIVAYGAQFSGHKTSLTGFKLTSKNPLTISSLSANRGPTAGGQMLIFEGTDLSTVTSVTFGGTPATITAGSISATAFSVTTPARSAGNVNVVVTTAAGSVTLTGAYTYITAPSLSGVSPSSGSTAGGQSVTLSGSTLSNASSVTFGGLPAGITSNSSSTIVVTAPPHAAGAVNVVVTTPGGSSTLVSGYTYSVASIAAPTGVVAQAVSTSQINVTWNSVPGATAYQVDRKAAGGAFVNVETTGGTTFADTGRPANSSFLYQVRAVGATGVSANSTADLATTILFTDNPLAAGTTVKAVHLAQLRTAVDAVRALAGRSAFSFTGSATPGTIISAVHLTQLRTALDEARGDLALSTGGYTDTSLSGVAMKAVHMQELRNRVE